MYIYWHDTVQYALFFLSLLQYNLKAYSRFPQVQIRGLSDSHLNEKWRTVYETLAGGGGAQSFCTAAQMQNVPQWRQHEGTQRKSSVFSLKWRKQWNKVFTGMTLGGETVSMVEEQGASVSAHLLYRLFVSIAEPTAWRLHLCLCQNSF